MCIRDSVRCVPDERDKRVRRLYTTDMVEPIAKAVNEARKQWNEYLTRGMTPEEAEMARTLLYRIAENAMSAVEREERET